MIKYVLAILLAITDPVKEAQEIAENNRLREQAQQSWEAGDYMASAKAWQELSVRLPEDTDISFNLAHSLYRAGQAEQAQELYGTLALTAEGQMQSAALQQLGVMATSAKKYEEAAEFFKRALKADPQNREARYNYELIKKLLEKQRQNPDEQQDQQQQQQQDGQQQEEQQQQDQQQQQKQDGEQQQDEQEAEESQEGESENKPSEAEQQQEQQQQGEEPPSPAEMQQQQASEIDRERAEMILRAMEQQEKQYYQQLKRKSEKKNNSSKPDW